MNTAQIIRPATLILLGLGACGDDGGRRGGASDDGINDVTGDDGTPAAEDGETGSNTGGSQPGGDGLDGDETDKPNETDEPDDGPGAKWDTIVIPDSGHSCAPGSGGDVQFSYLWAANS